VVPERSRKLYEKGKKALGKGEYSKAQESLHAALSVYPNFPRARNALAVTYAKQHDFANAASQLEIAITLDPQFGEAYFNYGMVMMETGRYANAATHLARALDLEFSPENVADSLISSEIHANQPDAAVAALRTIHKRKFQHRASLHWEIANLLDTLGRRQDAEAQVWQFTSETQ
jgi:Tfp pilus assembly protein PilF